MFSDANNKKEELGILVLLNMLYKRSVIFRSKGQLAKSKEGQGAGFHLSAAIFNF